MVCFHSSSDSVSACAFIRLPSPLLNGLADARCVISALTNLQELGIDDLQAFDFMPNIQQCFGHFAPTLRFLALKSPGGSCRQILYFIGLFSSLQDLKTCYPPYRGQLTFHEGEVCGGHDRSFWWTSFSLYGPLWGCMYAARFGCMCGNPGDIAVIPNGSIWRVTNFKEENKLNPMIHSG